MALDLSVGGDVYVYIAIYPNTNDDWTSDAPFGSNVLTTENLS